MTGAPKVDARDRDAGSEPRGTDARTGNHPSSLAPSPESGAVEAAEPEDAPEGLPDRPPPRRFERVAPFVAVGLGGILGADARYAVGLWAAERWGTLFPWPTLLVNVAGSLVLGFYLTLVTERVRGRPTSRLFVATGFLGAFTTFSAFSYETLTLVRMGAPGQAAAYVAASLAAGLAAVALGIVAAHAL